MNTTVDIRKLRIHSICYFNSKRYLIARPYGSDLRWFAAKFLKKTENRAAALHPLTLEW